MKKRILSLILACSLVVTGLTFPRTVNASEPTNVASGKRVYVSSGQESAGYLVDADNSSWSNQYVSEWCGDNVFKTQYIVIDGNYYASASFGNAESSEYVGVIFDEAYWFNSVTMESFLDEYPTSFRISVYNGSEWVDVVTKDAAPTSEPERTFNFDPICGSAVKLTANTLQVDRNAKETGNYYLKVVEMRVQGAEAGYALDTPNVNRYNACEGMNVTAGSVVDWGADSVFGSDLNNLIDNYSNPDDPNRPYTLYASTFLGTPDNYEWAQVTFDAPIKAHSVRFDVWDNGKGFPVDFKLQAYTGTEWFTLTEQTGFAKDSYRFGFAETECSAIRLVATRLSLADVENGSYALVIKDMQVLAENATGIIAKPVEVKKHYSQSTAAEVLSWGSNDELLYDDIRNNPGKYYTSQIVSSPEQEVQAQFLFDKSTYIERVRFFVPPNEKCPSTLKIFAFTGSEWNQIKEITGFDREPSAEEIVKYEFSFEPIYCSGIVIVASGLSEMDGGYGFRMNEIALMGCQGIADGMVLGDMDSSGRLTQDDMSGVRKKLMGTSSSTSIDFDMTWTEDIRDLVRAKRYLGKTTK